MAQSARLYRQAVARLADARDRARLTRRPRRHQNRAGVHEVEIAEPRTMSITRMKTGTGKAQLAAAAAA
jgi:hypothetical protein